MHKYLNNFKKLKFLNFGNKFYIEIGLEKITKLTKYQTITQYEEITLLLIAYSLILIWYYILVLYLLNFVIFYEINWYTL